MFKSNSAKAKERTDSSEEEEKFMMRAVERTAATTPTDGPIPSPGCVGILRLLTIGVKFQKVSAEGMMVGLWGIHSIKG